MGMNDKYRVHEVAKDFGVATKQVTEILTKYAETPKNHMQVLTDRELSLIFESLTQNNQVAGIHVIFAEGAKAAEKKQEAKAAPAPAQQPQQSKQNAAPARQEQNKPQQGQNRPQQQGNNKPQAQQQVISKPTTRVPETRVVDTRKATNVNLDKYDEKLQDMAESRNGGRRDQQQTQGKEKIRNNKKRDNNFGNKRKQEEADRMRRLQLEIIKKTPVTVEIGDEISVGELASRMKKTGAEVVK